MSEPRSGPAGPDPATRRLRALLEGAAAGDFPPADGALEVLPPASGPVDAVLAFSAHHVVAAPITAAAVTAHLDPADLASPMGASFLAWLGSALGAAPGTLDVVLAAPAVPAAGSLDETIAVRPVPPDPAHPRVARAIAYRDQVRAWATWDGDGILVIGRGLAGRWEAAFEVEPAARDRGLGRRLAAAARRLIPPDEHVFVQVAPGNARCLRAVLAAGYRPLGGEVLFLRDRSG